MFRVTAPGLYTDIPADDYYADPCPDASLTQSLAKVMLHRSPLHAWWASPRLNPRFKSDSATKFDLAHAAHWHLTGRGKDMVPIEADDWRSKKAREARMITNADGKTAVLREQFDRAGDMAEAALDQLAAMGLSGDWRPDAGDAEVMVAARDSGIWLRALIDWLPHHRRIIWDYKTTRASAAPQDVASRMAAGGWHIQAAMHDRLLNIIDPDSTGRRKHRFVVQESEEPYALTVADIPEAALTIGRMQIQHAINLWCKCMRENNWPGYPQEIAIPELSPWAQQQWPKDEIVRGKTMPADLLMAG
jgi:PDDEXK-like domain of unknown function (DUF3799)